jgi:hypothetical protein
MRWIDQDKGATSQVLDEIRGNSGQSDTYENIPKLLALDTLGSDVFGAFLRFLDTPENTEAFPVVHNLFFKLVLDDIAVLQYEVFF